MVGRVGDVLHVALVQQGQECIQFLACQWVGKVPVLDASRDGTSGRKPEEKCKGGA